MTSRPAPGPAISDHARGLAHDGFELAAWLKMNRNASAFSVPHVRSVDVRTARPRWAWTLSASWCRSFRPPAAHAHHRVD